MARRKTSKAAADEMSSSKVDHTTDSLRVIASPVAAVVNLEGILSQEFSARREPEGIPEKSAVDLVMRLAGIEKGDSDLLNVSIAFELRVFGDKEDEEPKQVLLEIKCTFLLIYRVSSFDGLSDENLMAFANTSCVFSAWPYWREYVHSASFRLSIEPIVLPTYHS
jgi:hypothetical protein